MTSTHRVTQISEETVAEYEREYVCVEVYVQLACSIDMPELPEMRTDVRQIELNSCSPNNSINRA